MGTSVVISKHWHRPGIAVSVLRKPEAPAGGITLELPMADFLQALTAEIDAPLKIWTKAQMGAALRAATDRVLEKTKEASTFAIAKGT